MNEVRADLWCDICRKLGGHKTPSTPAVKFRATCEACGERQPRATTSFTVEKWMANHLVEKHHAEFREEWR